MFGGKSSAAPKKAAKKPVKKVVKKPVEEVAKKVVKKAVVTTFKIRRRQARPTAGMRRRAKGLATDEGAECVTKDKTEVAALARGRPQRHAAPAAVAEQQCRAEFHPHARSIVQSSPDVQLDLRLDDSRATGVGIGWCGLGLHADEATNVACSG